MPTTASTVVQHHPFKVGDVRLHVFQVNQVRQPPSDPATARYGSRSGSMFIFFISFIAPPGSSPSRYKRVFFQILTGLNPLGEVEYKDLDATKDQQVFQVTLKEGVRSLGELTFTDNSSGIRSRKFRLGMKVALGFCEGMRVHEAKTEAFTVKDQRGELYKKHYPATLNDEVWILEKIGKDGSFHKRLNKEGIFKVKDFLRLVVRDSQKLRDILGSGMSNKMWEALLEHAKTCVL